jgi:O-antigen ligase
VPPSLAALLTLAFIVALVVGDTQVRRASPALWLPCLWLWITGSRFVSQWLDLGSPAATSNVADGSLIDALYFAVLLTLGSAVLARRREQVWAILKTNRWLVALVAYGFVAIAWSDFPVVSFKRWVKTLGHPVMALILLTEPRPTEAVRIVMKRCAYVLLPLSVLFIKYFPEFGRGFDPWSGMPTNNGVGLTKNDLGYVCMVFGLFFVWNLLSQSNDVPRRHRLWSQAVSAVFLGMTVWLLATADSATSLATLLIGTGVLLALRFGSFDKRKIGLYVIAAIVTAGVVEVLFDPYEFIVVQLLGREPDLTDRKLVWVDAIALQPNALVGAGFEAFWLGDRLQTLWAKWWWRPNQAHNGYIETYLNLGIVGVVLLVGVIVSAFTAITSRLRAEFGFADLRLALLFAILAFNYTEAAFKGVHLVWTMFFLVVLSSAAREESAASDIQPKRSGRGRFTYLDSLSQTRRRPPRTPRRITRA